MYGAALYLKKVNFTISRKTSSLFFWNHYNLQITFLMFKSSIKNIYLPFDLEKGNTIQVMFNLCCISSFKHLKSNNSYV